MYIRQNRLKNRLGAIEGGFGQVPVQTITIADPVDGSQLTFSGLITEMVQVQALVGLVSGAVGAAKQNKTDDAKRVLTSAKNLLPSTGSQRDKASFLVNKAERFITDREAANRASGTSAGEVLTGVGAILAALAPAAQTAIQTQADAAAAKRALRAGQQAPGQQQPYYGPPPADSNTGLIIAVVGGLAVVGVLIMVMSKKK